MRSLVAVVVGKDIPFPRVRVGHGEGAINIESSLLKRCVLMQYCTQI